MIQKSKHDEFINEHFEWMYHLVCNDYYYTKLSYRKLLYLMHSTNFYALLPMDDNRRIDGIDYRYCFGIEKGYNNEYIEANMNMNECSVLEMMVALANDIEDQITENNDYGNRIGQWFWSMVVSLGLGKMDDKHFDKNYSEKVLSDFLNRKYSPNGRGGLFTLANPPEDMRGIDIWCQCMWYLNETFIE